VEVFIKLILAARPPPPAGTVLQTLRIALEVQQIHKSVSYKPLRKGEAMRKFLFLAAALALLTATAAAGVTVDPNVIDANWNSVTYNISVTNTDSDADRMEFVLPQTSNGPDPYGNVVRDNVTVEAPGDATYSLENGEENDNDGVNDTIVVESGNGVANGENFRVIVDLINPGEFGWDFRLYNGGSEIQSESVTVRLDDEPPYVTSGTPNATGILEPTPEIEVDFTDGEGGGVANHRLVLNGEKIDDQNITVDQGSLSYTPLRSQLEEGKNNVSIYLEDKFGYAMWHNWTFRLAVEPVMTGNSPTGLISEASPTVTATLKDPSGLSEDDSWIMVDGDKYGTNMSSVSWSSDDNTATITLDVPNRLDEGDTTATVRAVDTKGNTKDHSWTLTVDTQPPAIDDLELEKRYYDGEQTFWAAVEDTTSEVESVTFELADDSKQATYSDPDDQYFAKFDTREFPDGNYTLEVRASDEAGNTNTVDRELTIDNDAPSIEYYDFYPELTNVAPSFEMTASDSGSPVVAAEYFIDNDPGEGEAINIPLDDGFGLETDFSTDVDISSIEDGDYTFYFRAKDRAGHWSSPESLDFTLDRDLTASLRFRQLPWTHITQGETGSFPVTVRNTGKVPATVNLSVSGALETSVDRQSVQIRPHLMKSFSVTVQVPEEADIGNKTLTLTAVSRKTQKRSEMTVTVEPSRETRQELQQRIREIEEQLQEVDSEQSDWADELDDQVVSNVSENLSEARNIVERAEERMEQGDYRYAESMTGYLSSNIESTDTALEKAVERYRDAKRRRNRAIAVLVAFIFLTSSAVVLYQRSIPEEGFGETGFVHRPEDKHPARVRFEESVARARERFQEFRDDVVAGETREAGEDEDGHVDAWRGYDPS